MENARNKMEFIDITKIDVNEQEIKENDSLLIEKIKKTISKYGQVKSIVVVEKNDSYLCVDGSKVLRCMKELQYSEAHCINVGKLSDEDELLLRISISRDYFLTNYVLLGELFKELRKSKKIEDICNFVPFDTRQVNKMIDMTEFDWEAFNQNKQIEGQITMFDVFEETNQEILSEQKQSEQEVEEFIFPTSLDIIHEPKKVEEEKSNEDEKVEVKDWKDVILESEPQKPQGFFEDLEFELAEPKKEDETVQQFDDLPWEDETLDNNQNDNNQFPFKFHEHEEYSLLELFDYKEDITELCKQLSGQYIKHKHPSTEIVDYEVYSDVTEKSTTIRYIQCIDKFKIKYTVRMQNIYQSIIELYEL